MGGKGHHPSSSESDDWGDESWIVDCPCGVNYDDGEEMVECDECGVWVHTACCRVPKGLPTYVCDKCKIKKKLKESEESEVAQLLAELPSKSISFDERNHEKAEAFITGRHSSSEIPIEERAHVHGIAGGDPSFFVGASKVFCRELWKYTGYVPKHLKIDYKELPESREDVFELLRDLPEFELPISMDYPSKFAPLALENGHATLALALAETDASQDGAEEQVHEETLTDKQGKDLHLKKDEVKNGKHNRKLKCKEETPHHHGKRVRNEGGLKEQPSKKKPRMNGDVCKQEDGLWKKLDVSPSQEASLLGKSPLSSPTNPKAMKKLAVQEFMDGDVILCSVCGRVESLVDLVTGGSTAERSDSLCQECERIRGYTLPVTPKLETGSVKQEPISLPVPAVISTGTTLEVRFLSRKELDSGEDLKSVKLMEEGNQASVHGDKQANAAAPGKDTVFKDSSIDTKKLDVNGTDLHKIIGIHESLLVRDEKRKPSVKVEAHVLKAKLSFMGTEAGEIHEGVDSKVRPMQALESLAAKSISAASKPRGESAVKTEHHGRDMAQCLVSRPSCTDEVEACMPEDCKTTFCADKQAVSGGHRLEVSPGNSESSSMRPRISPECSPVPVLPSVLVSIPTEAADGNGNSVASREGRVSCAVVANTGEDRTSKLPASIISKEIKGQGSARTAGHLPASVRGKMHGEKCNQQLQRSATGLASQPQSSLSCQSFVQVSLSVTQRAPHTHGSPAAAMKGSCGEDPVVGKYGQVLPEGSSPIQQAAKQSQQVRSQVLQMSAAHKLPAGLPDTSFPSQPAVQRSETDHQLRTRGQLDAVEPSHNEFFTLTISPNQPQVASESSPDRQLLKPSSPVKVFPTQVFCQQARQLNGVGHVYTSRSNSAAGSLAILSNCSSVNPPSLTSQAPNSAISNTKVSASSLKSPSSGTSSSSPTSPLVTTPSSKPQLPSVKVPESPPPQRSLSGGSTPNASVPHSSSKFLASTTSIPSSNKQGSTLVSSKSVTSLPGSPQSTKCVSMSKQSLRCSSLPVTKGVDGSSSVSKATAGVVVSRGGNHSGSSSGGLVKDNKNVIQPSNKPSSTGKINSQPVVAKPPSAKSSHSHVSTKGFSGSKQHSGPGTGASKASTLLSTTKFVSHQNKVGMSHKDEKPGMPSVPPGPKAMSTMPPPAPQLSTKRSPPMVLTSAVATTLKDEELALLLHQELNSSPRVPRVPRVRQAGASLQLVSAPSLLSAKGSFVSASGGVSHKDHVAPRKRTREDRHKDLSRSVSQSSEEGGKIGGKRAEEKMEDGKGSLENVGNLGTVDGSNIKEKSGVSGLLSTGEGNARHHSFARGNLSIIVPGNDDVLDGDKKSPVESNVVTLPGLIDEVLSSRGPQLSYEDVCEAVLPHWSKLRKPNGERYAYVSHRQAVLDCLRNRSAWAHLVGRGPKTNPARKRRRNDSTTLSDTDDEESEHVGYGETDDLDTSKPLKHMRGSDGEKWEGDALDRQKGAEAATLDDVPKGKRKARRRRRVAIEDGTDGEDEPADIAVSGSGQAGVSKSGGGTSQSDEPEAESSPSSEEAVSNYSEEDEEMVVHRGIRNRRRPADESSGSEDDVD